MSTYMSLACPKRSRHVTTCRDTGGLPHEPCRGNTARGYPSRQLPTAPESSRLIARWFADGSPQQVQKSEDTSRYFGSREMSRLMATMYSSIAAHICVCRLINVSHDTPQELTRARGASRQIVSFGPITSEPARCGNGNLAIRKSPQKTRILIVSSVAGYRRGVDYIHMYNNLARRL